MKNKNIVIKVLNVLFFLTILFVTFFVIFKKNDIGLILDKIMRVNILYIFIAILFMFIYISCEGINIRRVLITLGDKISILSSFKYAAVGFFFSAITPSASGGDPAQLYFMSKDKVSISHSALALLVELCSFQLVTGIFAIVGFIFNKDIILYKTGYLKYFVFLGILINIGFLSFLVVMIFSKKVAIHLLNLLLKFLDFLHYKKIDKFKEKCLKQIEEYHNCSLYLKSNKKILIKIFLTTFVELILYHSVPYLIYLSFGFDAPYVFKFITLSAVLYAAVGFIPLPGAMGVSEGGFIILYKMLFPNVVLSSAMIISRGISYYLFVVLCGIFIIIFILNNKIRKRKIMNNINKK